MEPIDNEELGHGWWSCALGVPDSKQFIASRREPHKHGPLLTSYPWMNRLTFRISTTFFTGVL